MKDHFRWLFENLQGREAIMIHTNTDMWVVYHIKTILQAELAENRVSISWGSKYFSFRHSAQHS
jgi:hypothetical protein